MQNRIDKFGIVFTRVEFDILNIHEFVVDVFIFFEEIDEFERTAKEKIVSFALELEVKVSFNGF